MSQSKTKTHHITTKIMEVQKITTFAKRPQSWTQPFDNLQEFAFEKSLTIPNQALDIQTILKRHSQGIPLPEPKSDPVIDQLNRMDKIEKIEYIKRYNDRITEVMRENREAAAQAERDQQDQASEPELKPKPQPKPENNG